MDFFSKMFSGDDSASYGRWASFLALVCLLIWASLIVSKKADIPDIPANWLLVVCIPFGISKAGETANAIWGKMKGGTDGVSRTQG
ncbi:MAG: hypothetical protein FD174_2566 [Geobacteraceae bacterium]|nr:MAG: hypothetical protein FD174_2566 [Geobacteraceae bacterium]